MKKIFKITVTFILLAAMLLTFSACGDNKKKDEKSSSNPIVGSWEYDGGGYSGYDFIYTFNDDGTGKYDAAGTVMEFTYELKDGNKISILYKNNTAPFETEYKIEGDTLNVIDSIGNDTIYKKVK